MKRKHNPFSWFHSRHRQPLQKNLNSIVTLETLFFHLTEFHFSVASQERPSALFQPYTSVIKRNTDILASAQKSSSPHHHQSSPHHHQTVNFSRDHVPRPENWQQVRAIFCEPLLYFLLNHNIFSPKG